MIVHSSGTVTRLHITTVQWENIFSNGNNSYCQSSKGIPNIAYLSCLIATGSKSVVFSCKPKLVWQQGTCFEPEANKSVMCYQEEHRKWAWLF